MKIGSLCTGYGGLDMALDGETVWVSDIDKHARTLLAHRFPDIPNLGDLTAIDWETVDSVDVLTAGYPCQPFSYAGKREGLNDDRHIWPHIADAVRVLRPRYAVFENVAGHISLGLATVLADLAALGFDAEWATVRASDVGAPHRRERLFIVATDTERDSCERWGIPGDVAGARGESGCETQQRQRGGNAASHRGATATDTTGDGRPERGPEPATRQRRQGPTVGGAALPADPDQSGRQRAESARRPVMPTWGDYGPAVHRWEHILGRPAPEPTTTGNTGRAVLNPQFVEWMMGLPAGWVTDVPGISRTGQLHLLGNGVVPQQAQQALAILADQAVAA